MKRITAILLAALLIVAMAVPVFADEEVTSSAGEFTYDAESGTISGSYEADGLVELYLDGKLAGSDYINKPAEPGDHTVAVYVDGVLIKEVPVTAAASEDPGTDEPTDPVDPGNNEQPTTPENPTTPTQPSNNSGSSTTTNTTKAASNVPKTGDAENMGAFLVLGLGAALTLVAAKRVKSR